MQNTIKSVEFRKNGNPFEVVRNLVDTWQDSIVQLIEANNNWSLDHIFDGVNEARYDCFDDIWHPSSSMWLVPTMLYKRENGVIKFMPMYMLLRSQSDDLNNPLVDGVTPGFIEDLASYRYGNALDVTTDMHCGDKIRCFDIVITNNCFYSHNYEKPLVFSDNWKMFETAPCDSALCIMNMKGDMFPSPVYFRSEDMFNKLKHSLYATVVNRLGELHHQHLLHNDNA